MQASSSWTPLMKRPYGEMQPSPARFPVQAWIEKTFSVKVYSPRSSTSPGMTMFPSSFSNEGKRAPCSAFPGLTQTECDQINDEWHNLQVDLSHRSKYAQLRIVAGAGHRMHQEKPEAIAQAIHDVLEEVKQGR